MALLEEQFTETLNAGAPDITYEGNEGREQQIAQALWDKLPPQVRMQFGSFQQFFSSGAWKKVLEMLQQQQMGDSPEEVQDPRLQQEGQAVQEQGIGGLMPQAPGMAGGGIMGSNAGSMLVAPTADGSRPGYSAWDKIKKRVGKLIPNELKGGAGKALGAAALGYGLNQFGIPGTGKLLNRDQNLGKNWFSNLNLFNKTKSINTGEEIDQWEEPKSNWLSGIGGALMNPNFLIPAASLVSGAFAKPDEPGYTGQGTGLNLQDIGKLANISDPQVGMAAGLRFLPDVETRKFTPEQMVETYANAAHGGRIRAQEGGLMDLGGMEKDYRNDGGFVPIGGEEKADDVPARLSRNEFVFTADAVRNAGGGDMDRGAEVMENVMKNLEGGGKISDESQGKGAGEMFEVSERLSEVV